jgi:ribulose-phosphate 3-epimerase
MNPRLITGDLHFRNIVLRSFSEVSKTEISSIKILISPSIPAENKKRLQSIFNTFAKTSIQMSIKIAPSILAADFANLQRDIELVNQSDAHWFHIDIMDGVFVPNISFGMPVLEAIAKHAKKTIDVHLMIVDPDRYIKTFADLGSNILTVHYEACNHLHRTLQAIKAEGMQAGVALNPHTNVSLLEDTINDIDLVCLMSVNPGFGGQSFIENTYKKVKQLKEIIERNGASTKIEIDGGVTSKNASQLVEAGADVLVAGSFVFRSENPLQTIADLNKQVNG